MSGRRLPEIPLVPNPATDEARGVLGFKWAGGAVGHRHEFGGHPDWLQQPNVPACSDCGHAMTFYGQLDPIGDSVAVADVADDLRLRVL